MEKIKKNKNKLNFSKVYWQEDWKGILKAHFWLKNEYASYLGNYLQGGGALQEHSHGLHISICIYEIFENIKNFKLQSNTIYKKNKNLRYDLFNNVNFLGKKFNLFFQTDLIEDPSKKRAEIFGDNLHLYWILNYKKNYDAVIEINKKKK